jgi:hypothetical protein
MLLARMCILCHVPHWMCVCILGDTWCTVGLLSFMTGVLCVISCKDNFHNCVCAGFGSAMLELYIAVVIATNDCSFNF